MDAIEIVCAGRSLRVWTGGAGTPVLLLHGGWGGAAAYWGAIWPELVRSHRVIAPELPGIAADFPDALPSYRAYAGVCAGILDQLGVGPAIVCGNSLGAVIGWDMALAYPLAVARLVMINGYPPQPLPAAVTILSRFRPLRALAEAALRRDFYSPRALAAAFSDPASVPDEIEANLRRAPDAMVANMFRLLLSADATGGLPSMPVTFVWGLADRLRGLGADRARKLQRSLVGSRLVGIPDAGHMPQVERPTETLAALLGAA